MGNNLLILIFLLQIWGQDTFIQNNIGLQELHISHNDENYISITMVTQEKKLSILMICDSTPNFTNISQIYIDTKFNCLSDWNAFDFDDSSQQLMIIFDQSQQFNSKADNIKYLLQKQQFYIGVFSSNYDSFTVEIQTKSMNQCLNDCKNGGECQNNRCICKKGFFDFDCRRQGVDILKEQYLQQNTIYFLDLGLINKQPINLEFQENGLISYQCINLDPYFKKQQIIFIDTVSLSNDDILNCIHSSKQNLFSNYYIIQSQQKELIYILQNQNDSSNDYKTILIAVLSSCLVFVCCVGICLFKCYKQRKIVVQNNTNITVINIQNQKKTLDIQLDPLDYVPALEFQKIVQKIPKLQEQNECLICLDIFRKEQYVRVTYCNHIFHYKCFDAWMKKNQICPMCRSPQDKKSVQKQQGQEKLISIIQTISQNTEFNNEISSQKPQKIRNYVEYPIMTNNRSTVGSSKLIQINA